MTDHDVIVVAGADEAGGDRGDRSFAEQLVAQARADGVNLVGPGGLLAGLTKQVLEAGLEAEVGGERDGGVNEVAQLPVSHVCSRS